MKTKEELLKFYNVKLGKKYRIIDISKIFKKEHSTTDALEPWNSYINVEFKIKEIKKSTSTCSSMYIDFDSDLIQRPISFLADFNYEEVKESILNNKEKEYLSMVIKPFRNEIDTIRKITSCNSNNERIIIQLYDKMDMWFPEFKPNSMYKGMEKNKEYTKEELEL